MQTTASTIARAASLAAEMQAKGQLVPALGLMAIGASAAVMATAALAFPQTAPGLAEAFGACNPFAGDFGCGHGFGCACHMLPPPGAPTS